MGWVLATSALAVALLMLVVWAISVAVRDASIVDIAWGPGFVLVAWVSVVTTAQPTTRAWLMVALTSVWGLRLGGYLARRNLGKGEDYRYRAMRARHGDRFWFVSLRTVFATQGVLMWVVSLPVQVGVAARGSGLIWLDVVALAVWATGLTFEAIGDWQMARFKADPTTAGTVMDRGLWAWTRHPNYFGDFLVWWGLYLLAVASGDGWWTIIGPVVMSVLLIRVSGAALLERSLRKRREGYDEYVARTAAFFPRPPRRTTG